MTKDELKRRREAVSELHRLYVEWFDSGKYVIDSIELSAGSDKFPNYETKCIERRLDGTVVVTISAHERVSDANKEKPNASLP